MHASRFVRLISALFLADLMLLTVSPAAASAQTDDPFCSYDPQVAALLDESDLERWVGWMAELSGDAPIQTPTGEAAITTRSSMALQTSQSLPLTALTKGSLQVTAVSSTGCRSPVN